MSKSGLKGVKPKKRNNIEIDLLWVEEEPRNKSPKINTALLQVNHSNVIEEINFFAESKGCINGIWFIYELKSASLIPYFTYNHSKELVLIKDLIVYIPTRYSFIRGFYPLNFKFTGKNIVESLNKDYKGIISVRGDGACYYRSVIISLLTSILYNEDSIEQIQEYITNLIIKFNDDEIYDFLSSLIIENRVVSYIEFIILYTQYDKILITKCKELLIRFIEEIESKNTNLKDLILIYKYNSIKFNNLKEFCKKIIKPFNRNAEGAIVDAGLLPAMLGCDSLGIARFITGIIPLQTQSITYGIPNKLPKIYIVLDPGHYDVMIPKISGGGASASLSEKGKINDRRKSTALASAKEDKTNIINNILFGSISPKEKKGRLENLLKSNSLNQIKRSLIYNLISQLESIIENQTKSSGGGSLESLSAKEDITIIINNILSRSNLPTQKIGRLKNLLKHNSLNQIERSLIYNSISQLESINENQRKSSGGGALASLSAEEDNKSIYGTHVAINNDPSNENILHQILSAKNVNNKIKIQALEEYQRLLKIGTDKYKLVSEIITQLKHSQTAFLGRNNSRSGGGSSLPRRSSKSREDSSTNPRVSVVNFFNSGKKNSQKAFLERKTTSRSGGDSSLPRRSSKSIEDSSTNPRVSVVNFFNSGKKNSQTAFLGRNNSRSGGGSSLPRRSSNLKNSKSGGSFLPRRYSNLKNNKSERDSSTKPRVSVVKFLEKKK